jgi:DNA uptake protein ComE-like DNA-binding protein
LISVFDLSDELRLVLQVSEPLAARIVSRRAQRRFADGADLKTVPGVDYAALDAKARLILFR